mmetsp:Transcript_84811/g.216003  ORF Transcript_84811/g.216003 Transcript_84811/m.216003 type:complete len:202 (+) Transcript_84811:86-691(+)
MSLCATTAGPWSSLDTARHWAAQAPQLHAKGCQKASHKASWVGEEAASLAAKDLHAARLVGALGLREGQPDGAAGGHAVWREAEVAELLHLHQLLLLGAGGLLEHAHDLHHRRRMPMSVLLHLERCIKLFHDAPFVHLQRAQDGAGVVVTHVHAEVLAWQPVDVHPEVFLEIHGTSPAPLSATGLHHTGALDFLAAVKEAD